MIKTRVVPHQTCSWELSETTLCFKVYLKLGVALADLITALTSNAQQSLTLYLVSSVCSENLIKEIWVLGERVFFSSGAIWLFLKKIQHHLRHDWKCTAIDLMRHLTSRELSERRSRRPGIASPPPASLLSPLYCAPLDSTRLPDVSVSVSFPLTC